MKKEEKKVPQLRFPKFKGDWEQRKLSELSDFITKGATPTTYGYDWQESGIPFFRNDAIKDNQFIYGDFSYISEEANEDLQRSEIHGDDILVAITGDIGKAGIVPKSIEKGNINQHTARVRIVKDAIPYFIYQSLITDEQQKKYQLIKTGLSMPQLSLQQIRDTIVLCPSIEEQSMIGEYFINLDNLITLHQRKLEKIRELKKGMLQKMFPKNGKKVPEIRFKGFTDDWEQRKFLDCYKMSSGYAFKMRDYCDSGIGLINGESIQHGIINDDNLNYLPESFIQQYPDFILKEGDIVVGLNRPITNGNLKIARIPNKYNDSLLYQRAGKIVYKGNCDKDFTYILLSKEILKYTLVEAVGSDQPFISTSKLDKWQMMIPSDIEEQKKIGDYFRNLDHLITLHQRKLEKIKELKKGLLQQMFV